MNCLFKARKIIENIIFCEDPHQVKSIMLLFQSLLVLRQQNNRSYACDILDLYGK